mgnify:CR=1 FL=1
MAALVVRVAQVGALELDQEDRGAVSAGLPVMYCDDRLTVGLSPQSSLLTGPDVASMATGLRSLTDPGVRTSMAAATAGLMADLAPERTAQRYVAAYTDLIERKAGRRG